MSPVGTVVHAMELECEALGRGLVVELNKKRRLGRGPAITSNEKRRRVTKTGAQIRQRQMGKKP